MLKPFEHIELLKPLKLIFLKFIQTKNMRLLFTFFLFTFYFASTAQIPSYVPTNGLVGWWPFNGNANDESGNGNNGTVNGAALALDRFGNENKAYYFNGHSSITANSSNEISNNINNELSISVWFKLNSYFNGRTSDFSPLISKDGPYWHQYQSFISSTGIGFWGPNIYQGASSQIDLNNWYNIVTVFKNGMIKFYTNNVLVGTVIDQVTGLQPCSGSVLEMGMDMANQVEYLNGELDDVAIYNRALTQEEITQLYTGSVTPSTPEDTTSNVGIGTTTPKRKLHVNDVMRLEPRNTAPANPAKGDIYFDGVINKIRYYNGTNWISL